MSRVLLVAPVFHGYARSLADAFERCGHQVVLHHYDELGRLHKKLRHELPVRLGRPVGERVVEDTTAAALKALRESAPEVVVVIKGDTIGEGFWEAVEDRRVPRVLWLYDELRRMHHPLDRLRAIGPIASYSHLDVAALVDAGADATYLPLAHDQHLARTGRGRDDRDVVVFVGARYPRREELMAGLHRRGVPVRAYGKTWSHHPVDRLRTWGDARPDVPWGRDLERGEAYRVMAAAAATLNVHGDQDGFTMRTFEACGVGAVQLVDRADVVECYDPGRELLVFGSEAELVDLVARARKDHGWARGIRRQAARRTLAEHTIDHRARALEERWQSWG